MRKLVLFSGVLALAACFKTYTSSTLVSNYVYEGKTYQVVKAEYRDPDGALKSDLLLYNEGVTDFTGAGVLAVCSSKSLPECEKTFGIVLSRSATPREEGGMY